MPAVRGIGLIAGLVDLRQNTHLYDQVHLVLVAIMSSGCPGEAYGSNS